VITHLANNNTGAPISKKAKSNDTEERSSMKRSKRMAQSQKLVSQIQLARLRVARAGSAAEATEKEAVLAKRRRKEARQAARRARKLAKAARAEFAEAQEALAKLEKKLAKAGKQAAKSNERAHRTAAAKRAETKRGVPQRAEIARQQPIPSGNALNEDRSTVPGTQPSSGVQVAVAPTNPAQPTEAP
jgi:hypothetical protein